MRKIFSGIQPTGGIHVGNYLGALRNWAELQHRYPSVFCIVDYHAITVPYDPRELPQRVREAYVAVVAAGVEPSKSLLFVQSQVPEHAELAWLFNTITPLGQLERMTQFKDKARQHQESVNAGLLNYPVLQAADILLYKADLVPVGEDQIQHIELTRDIARRFNFLFGETFPETEAYLTKTARIMALNDPERKMSKSLPGSYVGLFDDPEEIRAKVRRAVTDTGPRPDAGMSPGVANLFTLLEGFASPEVVAQFRAQYEAGTLRYSDLKQAVAESMVEALAPVRSRYLELMAKPSEVEEMMADGAAKARRQARETIREVREKMGFSSEPAA